MAHALARGDPVRDLSHREAAACGAVHLRRVYALLGTIVAEFLGAQQGMGVVIRTPDRCEIPEGAEPEGCPARL